MKTFSEAPAEYYDVSEKTAKDCAWCLGFLIRIVLKELAVDIADALSGVFQPAVPQTHQRSSARCFSLFHLV